VDAMKKYIEGGGRGLFALDPPLKFKGQEIADNAALAGQLASWGVSSRKAWVNREGVAPRRYDEPWFVCWEGPSAFRNRPDDYLPAGMVITLCPKS